MNRYEKIKAMSMEEMTEFIIDLSTNGVKFAKEEYVENIGICQRCGLYNADFDPDFDIDILNRFCEDPSCPNRLRPCQAHKRWLEEED